MTVDYADRFSGLKNGDKAPCGCEVFDAAWTDQEARTKVYEAIALVSGIDISKIQELPTDTTFESLGFNKLLLRRLWMKFFVACDVDLTLNKNGGVEYSVEDEELPPVAHTIEDFIKDVHRQHSGTGFKACDYHCPW